MSETGHQLTGHNQVEDECCFSCAEQQETATYHDPANVSSDVTSQHGVEKNVCPYCKDEVSEYDRNFRRHLKRCRSDSNALIWVVCPFCRDAGRKIISDRADNMKRHIAKCLFKPVGFPEEDIKTLCLVKKTRTEIEEDGKFLRQEQELAVLAHEIPNTETFSFFDQCSASMPPNMLPDTRQYSIDTSDDARNRYAADDCRTCAALNVSSPANAGSMNDGI